MITAGDDSRSGSAPLYFSAGALAIAVQVTLLREIVVVLQGDETAVGLGLAAWLAGITVGAILAGRLAAARPGEWASAGLVLLAVAGPLEAVVARLVRFALPVPAGDLVPVGASLLAALAIFALPGGLVGITFPSLAGAAERAGAAPARAVARLYVLESAGALAGGLVTTFAVIPNFAPLHGVLLSAAACLLGALRAARRGIVAGRVAIPTVALLLACAGLPPLSSRIEEVTVRARFATLAPGIPLRTWTDSVYQHTAIGGDGVRHLYLGGRYAGSFPDPEEEARAHVLACLAPRPDRVLVAGGLPLGGLRFLLGHPVRRIDVAEIDAKAFSLVRGLLDRADRRAVDDPRVRVVFDDPRRFLAREDEAYDLVLLQGPDPVTLLLARGTTVEFFRLVASRLAPAGVVVMPVAAAANVVAGEKAALAASIYGALREVFPVVHATPGPEGFLLAGRDPAAVTLDPGVLAERLRSRAIGTAAIVPETFGLLFPPERVALQEDGLSRMASRILPSRDARPVSFLHALSLRQREAGGALAGLFARLSAAPARSIAAPLLLPSLAVLVWAALRRSRGRPARRVAALHAVIATGACGMTWSLALLFAFQTRVGALYGHIGWLTAVFMSGLAAGGLAAGSGVGSAAPGKASRVLALASCGAGAFSVLLPPMLASLPSLPAGSGWAGPAVLAAGLFAAGAATGSLFPAAAAVLVGERGDARSAAALVEAADHAGAAAAAALGAVALIPALGLVGTCWLLAAVEGISLAVLAVALAGARGITGRGAAG